MYTCIALADIDFTKFYKVKELKRFEIISYPVRHFFSGCRVDTVFIPFGGSRVMDACNNVCACRSREGIVSTKLQIISSTRIVVALPLNCCQLLAQTVKYM